MNFNLEWQIAPDPISYPQAMQEMEAHVAAMIAGEAAEKIWLLEHPPVYTAGTSAREADLLEPQRFPVYQAGRGGQYTYHGPGQRIAYVMLDLQKRMEGKPDLRHFVWMLEEWIIQSLAVMGVVAARRAGRVGLWVARANGTGEDKVAALGIRVRKWVSFHGVSLNINPDLSHFSGIVPCGIREHGVTSLKDLGVNITQMDCDRILQQEFSALDWRRGAIS